MSKSAIAATQLAAPPKSLYGESAESIAQDIALIGGLNIVPDLLTILCNVTGMRFAAVARVTAGSWTACAVKDDINFGLEPGSQLDADMTLCIESRATGLPIVFNQASTDPRYCNHHVPKLYKIESYVSVPIIMPSGYHFGSLFALDTEPNSVSDPKTLAVFKGFARLLASHLETTRLRESERLALNDERAASELRETFIAILGHDLRSPLQAILATGELMERRSTDAVLLGMAGRIKTNVRRMTALIDDVLDFARGRLGGGISLQIKDCDEVEAALIHVVEELQDAKSERKIVLDIKVDQAVRCDIGRIQQALSNLLGNALTHGSSKSPVKVFVSDSATDLIMQVWNDGKPIPAASIAKIFEPFWRQTTSADREGLGLGLHICSQIVQAHGGTVSASSSEEHGTRFTVLIPLRPSQSIA